MSVWKVAMLWVAKSEAECACLFIMVLGGTDSSLHRYASALKPGLGHVSTAQARVESGSVR
jgi:hypothetical protein